MTRELFILRHAKSDWGVDFFADSERHLSSRGQQDAPRMGRFMRENNLLPEQVNCSTATRARETLEGVNTELGLDSNHIQYVSGLYLASLSTLLSNLSNLDSSITSLMLVGHNPGLDELVSYLSKTMPPLTDNGKLMTTCCLAHFKMPGDWTENLQHQAELISITRPADI